MDIRGYFEREHSIQFKRVSGDEYASINGCPWCGASGGRVSDRFHVWVDTGNYWCRRCGKKGFVDSLINGPKMTAAEREHLRLAARVARLERQQQEHDQRLSALERIATCTDHLSYHRQLRQHPAALEYWFRAGMTQATLDRYQLGYCERCPTDKERRASYTIPVINSGKLRNIRHRLTTGAQGDKYRPHLAGLPPTLFNADFITSSKQEILIVEGEKKSLIAAQTGFANVGLMGKSGFAAQWARYFRQRRIYVALDPDALEQAVDIAAQFEGRGYVVALPGKLDDLIVKYGARRADIQYFMDAARRV